MQKFNTVEHFNLLLGNGYFAVNGILPLEAILPETFVIGQF